MFQIILTILFILVAIFAPRFIKDRDSRGGTKVISFSGVRTLLRSVMIFFAAIAIFSTSFVYVNSDEVGHLKRIYFAKSMAPGQIIALKGEKGPQAVIIPPGFHFSFLIRFMNDIKMEAVYEVPEGNFGYLTARDGEPLRPDQMYADAFNPKDFRNMITEASFFLKNGGQKGPQTSILTPGKYRINRFLWDIESLPAKKIEEGHVGVIKSNVYSRVDFGNLKTEKPTDCSPIQKSSDNEKDLSVPIVPVGCIGVWEIALNPGQYYINEKAYKVIDVDTRVQTWEYKGGFTRRYIDLKVQANGDITQTETKVLLDKPDYAADEAVLTRVEGWVVPQELRALVQVTPKNAPFVVASVGGLQEVEDRILTPAIKSVVRNVVGGKIPVEEIILDKTGKPIFDEKGELKTKTVLRPTKVLDLVENRPILEESVEQIIHKEGLKAGVDIKEIRFGDPAIPPELLVARQREQLASQLEKAFTEEKKAQDQRIIAENAKATADQQPKLVEADIEEKRSERIARANNNLGRGEKNRLSQIAQGQKAQVLVLGEDRVVDLRKYELAMDKVFSLLEEHPEILTAALSNAHKFVPERVLTMDNSGGSSGLLGGVGGLFEYLGPNKAQPQVQTAPVEKK